jgi:hypothetical protein
MRVKSSQPEDDPLCGIGVEVNDVIEGPVLDDLAYCPVAENKAEGIPETHLVKKSAVVFSLVSHLGIVPLVKSRPPFPVPWVSGIVHIPAACVQEAQDAQR